MADYHLSAQYVQRSRGQSSVARAAYRAAEKLHDNRLGQTFNYARKELVLGSEILAPASAPAWATDRARLWNEVEAVERRKDAQLAREIVFALPDELDPDAQRHLIRNFVQEQFVASGMVADLAIHDTRDGNPHAHVMLTLRTIGPDGFGKKERAWNDKSALINWRAEWARAQNLALAHGGHHARVDHRSYADRGIAIEPTRHLGAAFRDAQLERAEQHAAIFRKRADDIVRSPASALHLIADESPLFTEADVAAWVARNVDAESAARVKLAVMAAPELRRVRTKKREQVYTTERILLQRENAKAILKSPALALDSIGRNNATFTERDIDWFLKESADPASFLKTKSAILASPELVPLGADARGRVRFTTRREIESEMALLRNVDALSGRHKHRVSSRLLIAPSEKRRMGLEQEMAYRHVVASPCDLAVVQGFAGSGKSYMLAAAREAWEAGGYKVHGAALAGKAAEGLQADSGIASRTLASWELGWNNGHHRLTKNDVFVIDEAGMVGVRQLGRVLEHVRAAGAKAVLVGDVEQLEAIEAGVAMRLVAERAGQAFITEVRRQRTEWMQSASREMGLGNTPAGLQAYGEHGFFRDHETTDEAITAVVAAWDKTRRDHPAQSQLMLAYRNVDVAAMNVEARRLMREAGALGDDYALKTAAGNKAFAAGDRLYFLRNNRRLEVLNGSLGTITEISGGQVSVKLDGTERVVRFNPSDYREFDHGYAATVHKSQGVTVDQAHVLASKHFDSHTAYVAMSRHRDNATLHWSRDTFANEAALVSSLSRESAKKNALDFEAAHTVRQNLQAPARPGYEIAPTHEQPALQARLRRAALEQLPRAELRDRLSRATEKAREPLQKREAVLDEIPKVVAASRALAVAHETHAPAAERWDKFRSAHPETVRNRKATTPEGRALQKDYDSAFVGREKAIRRLQKLRGNGRLNRNAQRIVDGHNRDVREAKRDANEIRIVVLERELLAHEHRHALGLRKWQDFSRNHPDEAANARVEKGGEANKILNAENEANKRVQKATQKLRGLDIDVQRPSPAPQSEGPVTPEQVLGSLKRQLAATEAWVKFATAHPGQISDARRGHGRGAERFAQLTTATDQRVSVVERFAVQELQRQIGQLEPRHRKAIAARYRRPKEDAERVERAAIDLRRKLFRIKRRLQRLIDPKKVRKRPAHVPGKIEVLRDDLNKAEDAALTATDDWCKACEHLTVEQACDARVGKGLFAELYQAASDAQFEYQVAAVRHETQGRLDHEAEKAKAIAAKEKGHQRGRGGGRAVERSKESGLERGGLPHPESQHEADAPRRPPGPRANEREQRPPRLTRKKFIAYEKAREWARREPITVEGVVRRETHQEIAALEFAKGQQAHAARLVEEFEKKHPLKASLVRRGHASPPTAMIGATGKRQSIYDFSREAGAELERAHETLDARLRDPSLQEAAKAEVDQHNARVKKAQGVIDRYREPYNRAKDEVRQERAAKRAKELERGRGKGRGFER